MYSSMVPDSTVPVVRGAWPHLQSSVAVVVVFPVTFAPGIHQLPNPRHGGVLDMNPARHRITDLNHSPYIPTRDPTLKIPLPFY